MRALIFPGQGSQNVGMGKELAAADPVAKEVFQEVDDALGQNLFRIMCEGPADDLTLTENAQPAIMAHALAVYRVAAKLGGFELADKASYVAGHSLGEYGALTAAGSFSLSDSAKLLKLRGQSMQQAVPVGVGAMAALLGADIETADGLASAARQSDEICTIANDNDPTQIVISGHKSAIDRALPLVKEHGIKRGVALPVSAPFHCPLMQPAQDIMADALAKADMAAPAVPVVANVTADTVNDVDTIRRLLAEQVTGRVRWRESVLTMLNMGVTEFVECGGKVLGPMVQRTAKAADQDEGLTITSLITMDDIEAWLKTL